MSEGDHTNLFMEHVLGTVHCKRNRGWGHQAITRHRRPRHWNNRFQRKGLTLCLCNNHDEALQGTSTEDQAPTPSNVPTALPGGKLLHSESPQGPPRKMPLTPRSEVKKNADTSKTGKPSGLTILRGLQHCRLAPLPITGRDCASPQVSWRGHRTNRERAHEEPRMSQC